MSMSLREQLLQAGLVSKKQVKDAEQQEHRQSRQARQTPNHDRGAAAGRQPMPSGHGAKALRDQTLNRQQREKAQRKALHAEIKQLLDQHGLSRCETGELYNFVDGAMVRRVTVDAGMRAGLMRGELVIVRFAGSYRLVPAQIGARIRERDAGAVVGGPTAEPTADSAYAGFTVPDDLIW